MTEQPTVSDVLVSQELDVPAELHSMVVKVAVLPLHELDDDEDASDDLPLDLGSLLGSDLGSDFGGSEPSVLGFESSSGQLPILRPRNRMQPSSGVLS